MKPTIFLPFLALLLILSTSSANAKGSGLKVHCEGDDVGAEVSVNGVFKGECPLVMEVAPGRLKLRVEKGNREFEKEIRIGDGVLIPVEVVLTKRLSAAEQAVISNLGMVPILGRDYELGKFEVTQLLWRTVMGSNPSYLHCEDRTRACGSDNNPVENISWYDVQGFLKKLNEMSGKEYRLPTADEWEYACFGGSQTKYCGGDNLDAVGWYKSNSGGQTHPVGQKQANGYGLYDMTGNVREMTSDCDGDCQKFRLTRGGSLWGDEGFQRLPCGAFTCGSGVETRDYHKGFRLARTLP
jgi:hypothetical protein